MTFRARIAIVSAVAVALTVVAASVIVFFVVRSQLRAPIDDALQTRAARIRHSPGLTPQAFKTLTGQGFIIVGPEFGESGTVQAVDSDGTVYRSYPEAKLPVSDATLAVARG